MKRLASYGFLSITLDDDFSNLCDILPRAQDIARLGKEQYIDSIPWRFLNRSLSETTEGLPLYVGWNIMELFREGTYGKIYRSLRMVVSKQSPGTFSVVEEATDVIVKQTLADNDILSTEDILSHTSEGLLHILAWHTMLLTATPWAIPQPYEVFGEYNEQKKGWESMYLSMSYVRGRTLYTTLYKSWKKETPVENSRMLIDILSQTAYILYHLQKSLRLNHRDVKINNILIRQRTDPVLLEIDIHRCMSAYEVILIDFGFACVGCPPPKVPITMFQSGSWFTMGDICCKLGRDIAQLLFCIHCYFPLQEYLTPSLYGEIKGWMQIPWSGGVADALRGFTKEGKPRRMSAFTTPEYHTGIYEFLRRVDVDPVSCEPGTVFSKCCSLSVSNV
jgi:serine/threonine protein kinase